MMNHSPSWLSAKDITDELRSTSFEADFEIERSELTEQSVRLLLLEMVTDGILYQVYGDLYGLQQFRPDPSTHIMAENARSIMAFREAYHLISSYPGHYTDERLYGEVGPKFELRRSDFDLAISDLSARGLAQKSAEGYWQMPAHGNEKPGTERND